MVLPGVCIGGEYTDVLARRTFALAATALLALAGCGSQAADPGGDAVLTVYVSAPQGPGWTQRGESVVDGARLALADRDGEAGGVEVRLEVLRAAGKYPGLDPAAVGENARRAAEDSTAIAYIGELEPVASETAGPIAREAGLLWVPAPPSLPERVPSPTETTARPQFPEAAYGSAAMRAVLAAIEAAEAPLDRASVAAAFEPPFGEP